MSARAVRPAWPRRVGVLILVGAVLAGVVVARSRLDSDPNLSLIHI